MILSDKMDVGRFRKNTLRGDPMTRLELRWVKLFAWLFG